MKIRVLKDGNELTSQTGDVGRPGSDGKVALSGDIGVAPAAMPAGIYTCEFTVDGAEPVSGSVEVKGPQGVDGASQVRMCTEIKDTPGRKKKSLSCAETSDVIHLERGKGLQCSAVVAGAKGSPLRVRIRKGTRVFDFPFEAGRVDKNLGVVTANITVAGSDDARCEVYKGEKLLVRRDFRVVVNG